MKCKIISRNEIQKIKKELWKRKKVVLVGGCFDILHFGHLTFLKCAKEQGDLLVVLLESDTMIVRTKHREPVHNQMQRAEVVSALGFVDYVIPISYYDNSSDYLNVIKDVKPRIIAVTDNDPKIHLKRGHAAVVKAELRVVCPHLTDFSTSQIIKYANIFSN